MRKLVYSLIAVTVFSFINLQNTSVSATSWVELKPQDVSDRAEVVVSGTYDFSSKPIGSEFIFQGYPFIVENVYKGEATKQIIAGIDRFDVGWAEGFQNEGGEFLLFLEKSDSAKFLIPVGGPNGMVQVLNDIVKSENEKNSAFYDDFLKTNHKDASSKNNVSPLNNQTLGSTIPLYIGVTALIAIAAFVTLHRYRGKRIR